MSPISDTPYAQCRVLQTHIIDRFHNKKAGQNARPIKLRYQFIIYVRGRGGSPPLA